MVTPAEELASAIADLPADHRLTLLDLTVTPVMAYQVEIDGLGVPRAHGIPGSSLSDGDLDDSTQIFVIAHLSTQVPEYIWQLIAGRAYSPLQVPVGMDVRTALRDAMSGSRTRQSYQLIVGRVDPSRDRILLFPVELFPAGAVPGDVTELSVRSVSSEAAGTVLAVVASHDGQPQLMSADSVRMEPGLQQIRAELVRPGKVRFIEPAGAVPDTRSWKDLLAAVPSSVNGIGACHVIWAVEVSGQPPAVAARLYRVEEFIKALHSHIPAPGQLAVSMVAYGAHRAKGRGIDDRVITDWMSMPGDALNSLGRLGAAKPSSNRTAQVEDALAEIDRRLRVSASKRTTRLVIVGDGFPFPARATDAIPKCPKGHDWEFLLTSLASRIPQRVAIRDRPPGLGATAWRRLGAGRVHALDAMDGDALVRHLGLIVPTLDQMPFPLAG